MKTEIITLAIEKAPFGCAIIEKAMDKGNHTFVYKVLDTNSTLYKLTKLKSDSLNGTTASIPIRYIQKEKTIFEGLFKYISPYEIEKEKTNYFTLGDKRFKIQSVKHAESLFMVYFSELKAEDSLSFYQVNDIYNELSQTEITRDDLLKEFLDARIQFMTFAEYAYHWEYWQSPDGSIVYMSPSSERITGFSREEFINWPGLLEEIIHPDDRQSYQAYKNNYRLKDSKTPSQEIDFRIITKKGEIKWIGHVCQKINQIEGVEIGYRISNFDITARKNAQEELLKSENRYKAVSDSITDFTFSYRILGNDIELEWVAGSVEPLTGYSIKEIMSFKDWEILVHPADKGIFRKHIIKQNQIANSSFELRIITKNKEERWLKVKTSLIPGKHKEERYLYGGASDITVEKRSTIERELTIKLLALINSQNSMQDIINGIPAIMIEMSGCLSAGVWLKDKQDKAIISQENIQEGFFDNLNLIEDKKLEEHSFWEDENTYVYNALCKKVYEGSYEKTATFFSNTGSFWTNTFSSLVGVYPKPKKRLLKNISNEAFIESLAIIPLKKGDAIFGFIHLSDKDTNKFTLEKILKLEHISGNLAMALAEKRAQQELSESEEKYRNLFESITDGVSIFRIDETGNESPFIEANTAAARMIGFSKEELLNTKPSELEKANTKEEWEERRKKLYQNKMVDFETRIKNKSGNYIDVSIKAILINFQGESAILNIIRDTTNQKKAELKVKESEEKYRRIADNVSDMVWVTDLAFNTSYVSPSVERIFGYKPEIYMSLTLEKRHPQWVIETFRHILGEELELENKQNANKHRSRLIEAEQFHANGSLSWVAINVSFLRDEKENIIGFQGVTRDISLRKATEKKLVESNQRNLAMLEALPDLMFVLDKEGIFLDYHNPMQASLIMEPQQFLGKNIFQVLPEHVSKLVSEKLHILFNKKKPQVFSYNIITEEQLLHYEGRMVIMGEEKALCIVRDITEHKASEFALQESEERFRSLYENATLGIYRTSPEGKILMANPALVKMLGYISFEELSERNLESEGFESSFARSRFIELIEKQNEIKSIESNWKTKDGSLIPVVESARLVRDAQGKTLYYEGIVENISERNKAIEDLKENENKYRMFVEQSTEMHFLLQPNGEIVEVNNEACKQTGYNKDELLKLSFFDLISARHSKQDQIEQWKSWEPTQEAVQTEAEIIKGNGAIMYVEISSKKIILNREEYILSLARNETHRKKNEQLMQARLRLIDYANSHHTIQLLKETLNELETLTGSLIGFFHYVKEDTRDIDLQIWSDRTLNKFCSVNDQFDRHYPIEQAGVWADCIREKRIILHNNYAALPNKKGLPVGHAAILREIVIPIIRNNKIVAILGLGNKPFDYNKEDVEIVNQLADLVWDIAEKKIAEESLKTSEERYRLLFNNMTQGYALHEEIRDSSGSVTDYAFIDINPAFETITGIKQDFIIGKSILGILPESGQEYIEAFKQVSTDGKPSRKQIQLKETLKYYDNWIFSPKPNHIAIMFSDITEKKQSEEQIEKLSKGIAQSPAAVVITNKNGDIEYINQKFSQITGFDQEEVIGMNISILNSGIQNELFYEELWETIKEGKDWQGDLVNRKKNGELYWESMLITPIKNEKGEIKNFIALKEDITTRVIAENKLKKNEEKYRLIFDKAPIGVFHVNEKGEIIECNDLFVSIIGINRESLIGMGLKNLPDQQIHSLYNQAIAIQNIAFERECMLHTSKKIIPTKIIISPVFNSKGFFEGAVGLMEDLSSVYQKEILEKQILIAKESVKFKQSFLANMSHEIRTPLTGMMGMLELFEKTKLDEQQQDYLSILKSTSENLMEIINQVLDFSKIEAGKLKLKPETFKLPDLFNKTKKLFTGICNKKGIDLIYQINKDIPLIITADRNRLEQILNNLMSNAIKFTEKGAISIIVSKEEIVSIRESFNLFSKESCLVKIRISVNDTGIGIPPEQQKILFTPFSQVEESKITRFEGTGLGLSICKQLAEMHGGEIGMESKLGEGSTFWFTFIAECKNQDYNMEEPITSKDQVFTKKLSILLAEDKKVNQKVISLLLTHLGHQVIVADNGQEVLNLYKPGVYDLILMDIQMPVMDGIKATQNLRRVYPILPPIVGLSANAFEGDREKYMSMGMDEYLTKPIKTQELNDLLKKLFL